MKKKLFWLIGIGIVVAVLVFAFPGKKESETEKVYRQIEEKYVSAMTADTYGGQTPQETLDLFVQALKAGDVDLASKYFMLDDNLSREKWVSYLKDIQDKKLLNKMADDISKKAKEDKDNITGKGDFKFVLLDSEKNVGARINMQLNKYSKVWKIESL